MRPCVCLLPALLALSACSNEPGVFRVTFGWDVPVPQAGTVTFEAEVISPSGRRTLAERAPFRPGLTLNVSSVPNGRDLYVEARAYALDARAEDPPRYFGRSRPFNLEPGVDIEVPVEVRLTNGPALAFDGPSVTILNLDDEGRLLQPEARLSIRARGIDRVEVAQDADMQLSRQTFSAEASKVADLDDFFGRYEVTYALNEDLDCAEKRCEGFRRIFVRGGRFDFVSPVETADAVLDSLAPAVAEATVVFEPAADNPLPTPTAARPGTVVDVFVVFDEAVVVTARTPQLRLDGPSDLFARRLSASPNGAAFRAVVTSTHAPGVYTPLVGVLDAAGNATAGASFAEPAIVVSNVASELLVDQTQVSYVRSTVGTSTPEAVGGFERPAGPYFALAPADPSSAASHLAREVFRFGPPLTDVSALRIWADPEREQLLQTAFPEPEGWARQKLRLATFDVPAVWVTGLDPAGNESAPVRINNAWFIATPNAPPPGTEPHDYVLTPAVRNTLDPAPFAEPASRIGGASPDAEPLAHVSRGVWLDRTPGAPPEERANYAFSSAAFDGRRGRLWVVGGQSIVDLLGFVYTFWDGQRWTPGGSDSGRAPGPRFATAAAYDSLRDELLVFGGADLLLGTESDETWILNEGGWQMRAPLSASPAARRGHAMAYHSDDTRTFMFGGNGNGQVFGDLWTWDGEDWAQVSIASGPRPPVRRNATLVYDSARGRLVLFGGLSEDGAALGDTWAWTRAGWQEIVPDGQGPPASNGAAAAYDRRRDRVVLFGGLTDQGAAGDVWELEGTTWRRANSVGPSPRYGHTLTYDHHQARVLLFGGFGSDTDVWAWDGATWNRIPSSGPQPKQRIEAAMTYDSSRGVSLLFGGDAFESTPPALNDLWAWDGRRWSDVTPAVGDLPQGRFGHAMTYVPTADLTIMFGGNVNERLSLAQEVDDTWVFDGTSWFLLDLASRPPARTGFGMAFQPDIDRLVLFGGQDVQGANVFYYVDTWEFDGLGWTRDSRVQDRGSEGVSLVYDEARMELVSFGGWRDRHFDTTWVRREQDWLDVSSGEGPVARSGYAMAYDSRRQRTVMVGGAGEDPLSDTWEWDGRAWRNTTSTPNPGAIRLHSMTYDQRRDRLILFGGLADGGISSKTWERTPPLTPGYQFTARLPNDIPLSAVQGASVRAACGGLSGANGDGAQLWGWQNGMVGSLPGEWVPLDSNGNTIAQPGPLTYRATTVAQARSLGSGRSFAVQCRPLGASSSQVDAVVSLDFVEVRIGYDTGSL